MNRLALLRLRHALSRALRELLAREGYLEVSAPLLSVGTCPDVHIESFSVDGRYLVTSTEYALKRLFADGVPAAYTLAPNFRRGELGERHSPEFTMLEWGRTGACLEHIEREALAMLGVAHREAILAGAAPHPALAGPPRRTTVASALAEHAGLDFSPALERDELLAACARAGVSPPPELSGDRTAIFTWLLDRIQPRLGQEGPELLVGWPPYTSTSAPLAEDGTTERSELFVAGVELADGFPFLRDAAVQRAQFDAALRERARLGLPSVTLDERYLTALGRLPHGAGMALGFDRLVMLAAGMDTLDEALVFGWARA